MWAGLARGDGVQARAEIGSAFKGKLLTVRSLVCVHLDMKVHNAQRTGGPKSVPG